MSGSVPLSGELALLISGDEGRREPVSAQAQASLGAPAHVVNQGNSAFVGIFLKEELVFDGVQVDEVAHACARVPADIIRIHVHFSEELDHLVLIGDVRLGAGCCGRKVCAVVAMIVGGGGVDGREREARSNFEQPRLAVRLHSHEGTGCDSGEGFGSMVDELHHHL